MLDTKQPSTLKTFSQLLLVFAIAYLPITSFQFAIKHDFFQAYFPMKYYLSEAIRNREIPLWNPFLNYGFPIYGDMSESYWNPLTWIIAFLGYTPYLFTIEQLLYMFFSGVSMYKLSGVWIQNHHSRLFTSLSYMCGGFMVAHTQHFNWITATGLLPACFYVLSKYTEKKTYPNLLLGSLLISFFITTSHPGMIIGFLYACIPFVVILKRKHGLTYYALFNRISTLGITVSIFSLGLIIGYLEVLPETNRSSLITLEQMKAGSTHLGSLVSLLFPMAVHASEFSTNDLSLRNCFIGFIPLTGLLLTIRFQSNFYIRTFLFAGLFFCFLSSAWILSLHRYIPLIQFIRLNGELRIFGLLFLQLAGMMMIDKQRQLNPNSIQQTLKLLLTFCAIVFLTSVLIFLRSKQIESISFSNWKLGIREWMSNSEFDKLLLIQSGFTLLLLSAYVRINSRGYEMSRLSYALYAECIGITWLCMPFTAVGMRSVKEYQNILAIAPRGIIQTYQKPEKEIIEHYPKTEKLIGGWGFYSKIAALPENLYYPLFLKENEKFFSSEAHKSYLHLPFSFLTRDSARPEVTPIGYAEFKISVTPTQSDTLVLKQNYYKGWKATNRKGDNYPIVRSKGTWLGIPLSPGEHAIYLRFEKPIFYYLWWYQLILFILTTCTLACYHLIRYILPYPARK